MSQKYSAGVRFNHQMGVLETLSFVGEGVGAGLFIASVLTGWPVLAAIGIASVIGAVVSLLAHLGKPARSWRALRRIATSGVSRGTAVISGFLALAILSLASGYIGFLAPLRTVLTIGAVGLALPVIVYAGLLLRSMRAIRLWRGPFLPLSFAAHSLATAATIATCLTAGSAQDALLRTLALVGLLLGAALSATHLLRAERSTGVRASLERLLAGDLRSRFLWGAWGVGMVVPVVAMALVPLMASAGVPGGAVLLLALAALSRLYGDFTYRNCIVIAGAYEPIMPVMPQRPLGTRFS